MIATTPGGILGLQRLVGNQAVQALLQRKPLASGKLNVVGEEHGESGARRGAEQRVANRDAGPSYWLEKEFRTAQGPADHPHFRIRHSVTFMLDAANDFVAQYARYKRSDAAGKDEALALSKLSFARVVEWGTRSFGEYQSSEDREGLGVSELMRTVVTLLQLAERIGSGGSDSDEDSDSDDEGEAPETVRAFIAAKRHLEVGLAGWGGAVSADALGRRRSQMMFDAANAKPDQAGVWKVGDDHVTHMQSLGQHAFEMLTRDEFNEAYQADLNPPEQG